jgi:transposase-like protein
MATPSTPTESEAGCSSGQGLLPQSASHAAARTLSITLDGYTASHRAAREIPNEDEACKRTKLRSSQYLNNLIQQDHRGIKSRIRPILGFKNFDYAAITIAGVELLHRIRKGQFALHRLRLKDQAAPAIWNAVLAA